MAAPKGKFDARPLRNALGSDRYRNCLAAALARKLNAAVARAQSLGRYAADREAAAWFVAFHEGHLLTTEFGDYDDEVEDAAIRLREMVREWWRVRDTFGSQRFPRALAEALKACTVGMVGGCQAVQLNLKVFEEFNRSRDSAAGAAKAAYKIEQLRALTD